MFCRFGKFRRAIVSLCGAEFWRAVVRLYRMEFWRAVVSLCGMEFRWAVIRLCGMELRRAVICFLLFWQSHKKGAPQMGCPIEFSIAKGGFYLRILHGIICRRHHRQSHPFRRRPSVRRQTSGKIPHPLPRPSQSCPLHFRRGHSRHRLML